MSSAIPPLSRFPDDRLERDGIWGRHVVSRACDGWVYGLKDQTLCFTGKIVVDGEWLVRTKCDAKAKQRGAQSKTDFSAKVSLVVHGDLSAKSVSDARRNYSDTLLGAEYERRRRNHVHVVDSKGFGDLIHAFPAPCLKLRHPPRGSSPVLVPPQAHYDVLGAPLRTRQVGRHDREELAVDLSSLDKATAAHEPTVSVLIAHLASREIKVHTYARNSPKFDAGWVVGTELFIAEVKGLTGTSQDQQIRLGIGQVLDYAHQLRHRGSGHSIRSVLVLEKKPADGRWASFAQAVGIRLPWGPRFEAI
ncbi:hypothetical protein ACH4LT_02520 [Streptomyces clavifer]|uniref:hypothetical protein n=1 Tax=Streptomyces clavifer TaxID=68188 RepID=UPI00379D436B